MKASVLKTGGKRSESRNDKSLGIQTYGECNDYPQRCKEIAGASGTARSCLKIYAKFIAGCGFSDTVFYGAEANRYGHTNDYLLSQVARDYADYGGFALHVNYNGLCQVVEVQHVPFETIRFEKLDDDGEFSRVATHPDWGRRNQALRRFRKEDIRHFYLFDPDPCTIQLQVEEAGGWDSYAGQIYYYSDAGEKTYPAPIYDPVLTDMSTEEGIANVKNRNARNSFLPAGMVIDKRNRSENREQESDLERTFLEFQTDENACKLVLVEVDSEEEIPEFKPFDTNSYDKEFDYSEKSVQQNIGRAFNQPPILRAEDVGGNFGAELITNAYSYYNTITETERLVLEQVFQAIYRNHANVGSINSTDDYSINPLVFGGTTRNHDSNP